MWVDGWIRDLARNFVVVVTPDCSEVLAVQKK